ncbi:hypothetical protein ACSQ67_011388 [Phaseolus vulgaris]
MYLRFLKAYCECAASFCYSIKLQLCCFVIECCWSFFGLGLLQALANTKDYDELFGPRMKEDKHASLPFKVNALSGWLGWWIGGDK